MFQNDEGQQPTPEVFDKLCRIVMYNLFNERVAFHIVDGMSSEDEFLQYLVETRLEEIMEYLKRRVDQHDVNCKTIKNYLKIEIVNSAEKRLSEFEKRIAVESVNILFNEEALGESELIVRQALQTIKLNGIDSLHTRDFAEFRESSLKFMLNYEMNKILKNHPIYMKQQLTSSPSTTEKLALNLETNRNGYIDIFIECLDMIIEIKHLHIGYISFSKEGFIGLDNETLSERVLFQKRENKSPLGQMLQIVEQASLSEILENWSIARLASVYKNQKLPFPIEYVRGFNPQAYYFEPVSLIFQDAREQILNYELENSDPKRLLIINIGKRLFYQFVIEDEKDWQDFKEIK